MGAKPPLLSKISLAQMQELVVRCGLPKTGAKLLLYNRIRTAAREHKPLGPDSRILSIDMGLKNFAYSVLTPAMQDSKALAREYHLSGDELPKDEGKVGDAEPSKPRIDGIIDTASAFEKLLKPDEKGNLDTSQTKRRVADLHVWRHLNIIPWLEVGNIDGRNTDALGEQFTPNTMADMAYRLITEHILPQKPTHILIERQRFRTGNQAGIFEWTVRVNMLESMIYAILRVMQNRGEFKGVVVPMPPKRVVNYLLDKYADEIPQNEVVTHDHEKRKKWLKTPFEGFRSVLEKEISPAEDKDDELLSPFEPPVNVDQKETKKVIKDVKKARMMLLANWFRNDEKICIANEEMRRMADYFVRATPVAVHNLLSLTKQKLKNDAVVLPPARQLPKSLGIGTFMGKREEKPERLTKGDHIEKMDDLCDSVTQGLVWIEWGLQLEQAMKQKKWIMEGNKEPEKPKLGIPIMKRTWGKGL